MSDQDRDEHEDQSSLSLDDDEMRALLRRTMRADRPLPQPDVLRGVQRKIRQRSAGKFFSDGWSVGRSPKTTYFVTSAVMLLIVVGLYLALVPGGWATP